MQNTKRRISIYEEKSTNSTAHLLLAIFQHFCVLKLVTDWKQDLEMEKEQKLKEGPAPAPQCWACLR